MIAYIILIVVILFGAFPFTVIELLLNGLISSVNVVLYTLQGIANGFIQFFVGALFGFINWGIGGLYTILDNILAGAMPDWIPLTVDGVLITGLQLPAIDFAHFIDDSLSPIGLFLFAILGDVAIANLVGAIAMFGLVIFIIIIALKLR